MATFNESESLKGPSMMAQGAATERSPLLSVVMPTRNRFQYAQYSIPSILDIRSDEIELVVQDSSDTYELGDWLADNVRDQRLRYQYTIPPVTMTENHNLAMEAARGAYVCLVGDDDTVLESALLVAQWAADHDIDAASSLLPASYGWPDFTHWFYRKGYAGVLQVRKPSGRVIPINTALEMKRCLDNPGTGTLGLPRVYHGIVRRTCLEAIRSRTGHYFGGVSPDMYGAATLALVAEKAVALDYPFTLPGSSGCSASGRSNTGRYVGRLTEEPSMVAYGNLPWPVMVPPFFGVETVWAEAMVEALQDMGEGKLLSGFNYRQLFARCLVKHRAFAGLIGASLRAASTESKRVPAVDMAAVGLYCMGILATSVRHLLWRTVHPTPGWGTARYHSVANVRDAGMLLQQVVSDLQLPS